MGNSYFIKQVKNGLYLSVTIHHGVLVDQGSIIAIERRLMVADDDLAPARRVLDSAGEPFSSD